MEVGQLNELQLDVIREVGNVGAGHAATALSQLTGNPIEVSLPALEIIPYSEVPELFGGPEELVGSVFVKLAGEMEGYILFMANRDSSLALVDMMLGRLQKTCRAIGHDEEKLITHTASMLISSYVAAIARMTDMSIMPSPASFSLDMAGAVLGSLAISASAQSDDIIFVRTAFGNEEATVDTALFFMPDSRGLEVILGRLGV